MDISNSRLLQYFRCFSHPILNYIFSASRVVEMGNAVSAIKHVGEEAVHGVEHVGSEIGHAAVNVGKFVGKRAANVYHIGDDVVHGNLGGAAHEAEKFGSAVVHQAGYAVHDAAKLAKAATSAVVAVGTGAAHVLKYVPVVGDSLSKGVLGAVDLERLEGNAIGDVANAVVHPLDALHEAVNTIRNPSALAALASKGLHTVQRVAGDVGDVAGGLKVVAPEFAPELSAVSSVANLIHKPTLSGIAQSALKLVPKGGKLERAVKFATRAAQLGSKAETIARVGAAGRFGRSRVVRWPYVPKDNLSLFRTLADCELTMRNKHPGCMLTYYMFDRGDNLIGVVSVDPDGNVADTMCPE